MKVGVVLGVVWVWLSSKVYCVVIWFSRFLWQKVMLQERAVRVVERRRWCTNQSHFRLGDPSLTLLTVPPNRAMSLQLREQRERTQL